MPIKAVLFDFMGTCLNWHASITSTLPSAMDSSTRSAFALDWRQTYFDANAARLASSLPVEDIDTTHTHTLETMLSKPTYLPFAPLFTPAIKSSLISAWHAQPPWPEVSAALESLKAGGYEVFVHANGSTRLQLDLCRFAGLRFDMLFSSVLLGSYKPARENYERVLELVQRAPEECVLVAAHAYDCRGAKAVGMRTVYVRRWTDDVLEDQEVVKGENDAWVEDMVGLDEVIARL